MRSIRVLSTLSLLIPCVLGTATGCNTMKRKASLADENAPVATASPSPVAPVGIPMASGAAADPAMATTPAGEVAPSPSPTIALDRASAAKPAAARAAGAAPPSMGSPVAAAPYALAPGAASVKAGEWDDNANYRDFQKFLGASTVPYHHVDLRDRRFLVVRDSKGQAVPRCRVSIDDAQQKTHVSFLTTASGRAILFPHAEGFGEGKMIATASCGDGKVTSTFDVGANDPDGVVDLRLPGERHPLGQRTIDLAFILDTTGSMSEEIAAVKTTIQKVASALGNDQTQVRVGLVEYKDRTDPFVTKNYPFSTDLQGFAAKVAQISAGGGGDTPEDMNAGLHAALTQLQWSEQSVARLAFVIGDAPPHLDYQDGPDYATDMKRASHQGIQLFTVAASGMDGLGQVVFRQMAQFTGGTEMFVLRGGAGPESVGGGDPGSSCGGTHTNYSSGKLDELIVQKIRRELKAIDADPMRIAGLKTDENAKPCNARIAYGD